MKSFKFLLLFLLLIVSKSYAQEIYFQRLEVEDGISQPTINSVFQDEFGIMWIATRDGLNRYDGTNFNIFRPIKDDQYSLYNNNIGFVCGDFKGHIYVRCKFAVVEYEISSNRFYTIRKDHVNSIAYGNNHLWFCTNDSVFSYANRKDGPSFYVALNHNAVISCIFESKDNNLYIGTTHSGLYVIGKNKKGIQYLSGKNITTIFEDSKKNIWIGTKENGVFKLSRDGKIVNYITDPNKNSLSSNYVRAIAEDGFGNFWIGTFKGLDKLDVATNAFMHYKRDNTSYGLSNSSVTTITKDQQGTLWVGTFYGGLNLFNPDYEIYKYYFPEESTKGRLSSPFVGRMVEDSHNGIWITTEGGGLNYLNRKTKSFTVYSHNDHANSISSNTVQGLYLDESKNLLWIGTLLGGLDKFDLKTRKISNFRNNSADKHSLINNIVRKIVPYQDKLILSTHDGVAFFNPQNGQCEKLIDDNRIKNRQIIDMIVDDKSNVWFSYTQGLIKINLHSRKKTEYFAPGGKETIPGMCLINVIIQDKSGKIWLGTSGAGLYLYQPQINAFKVYNTSNSDLINDFILGIKESQSGDLMIATNQGLSRFDTENKLFYNYNKQNGFPLTALNSYGVFVTRDNEIFLSGPKMMISFYEKELTSYVKPYRLNLISLEINNKPVLPGDKTGILSESLLYQDHIKLNHNHSIITINYSLSNYVSVLKNKIYYKLEGFDSDWISGGYRKSITYTNLNPGKYTLKIKSTEDNSDKESVFKELEITIKPPFYKSSLAYFIYFILIIILSYFIYIFNYSKLKLKASLAFEMREKEQIEEMNQSKLRFFTNISHEFRTPLTLMVSQLEMLMERNDIQPFVYNKLVQVYRNTNRMKRLITELLDFRKQEQGFKKLKYSQQNMYAFLDEIYLSFKEYARFKRINLDFLNKEDHIDVWFDVEQMEKVIYNLLSNAMKYTPAKGSISLSVEKHDKKVAIVVSDSGIGIPESDINRVFERFYQVDNSEDNIGTGIGLALSKSIVEAHRGKLSAVRNMDAGTTFIVELNMGDAHIEESQKVTAPNIDTSCISELTKYGELVVEDLPEEVSLIMVNEKKAKILIVEDNDELRDLLMRLFSKVYQVNTARDGDEGFKKTLEQQPDIVLSDIMMPIMSGFEMCRKIKTNFETSHIPVILLTAQTAEEYSIQGLKMGADDYVTKPFNVKRLYARCNNLINGRKMLQAKYAKQIDNDLDMLATNSSDHQFMEECVHSVERNLDNPNFDVNLFAQNMKLGRTKLFLKIKGITGQTPNDFILNIRLKKAQMLLLQSDLKTVSEIAYEVGFNSPSYFIKRYRELFGITPSQYQKKGKNKS